MLVRVLGAAAAVALAGMATAQSACVPGICDAPDNGNGTVDLPGPCAFRTTDGGTIDIPMGKKKGIVGTFTIDSFFDVTYELGGTLEGEIQTFTAMLNLHLEGTGKFVGFDRQMQIPLTLQSHSAPRPTGDIQSFRTDLFSLDGQLFGDPDFDMLRGSATATSTSTASSTSPTRSSSSARLVRSSKRRRRREPAPCVYATPRSRLATRAPRRTTVAARSTTPPRVPSSAGRWT
jgi:hypothetical protein